MPLIAPVKDGEVVQSTASSNSLKNANKNDLVSSDTFLQLLVAEMQNQDPLEPTSNTDWIAQYATFTQVSEIQNIGKDMESMSAQGLVGKNVVLNVEDAKGNVEEVTGRVEYVTYEDKKAFVSIDGKLYSVSDVSAVMDEEYNEAYNLAQDIAKMIEKLPHLDDLTIGSRDDVAGLKNVIDNISDYQKGFLPEGTEEAINKYYNKMVELVAAYNEKLAAAEAANKENAEKEAAEKLDAEEEAKKAAAKEQADLIAQAVKDAVNEALSEKNAENATQETGAGVAASEETEAEISEEESAGENLV